MNITIVTPWLDAVELIPAYWRAIRTGLDEGDATIVIDNGSTPPLSTTWAGHAKEDPGEWISFVRFNRNIGFGRACNVGLDRVETDAVLFLNNDIRSTGPSWLKPIREALRPGVLVGGQLRDDAHTAVDGTAVPYLDGWCIAAMRDDFLALSGWNEGFEEPAYYGDNELCVRARANGMELVEAKPGLLHVGNYTSRRMDIDGISARNRARYEQAVRDFLAVAA